MLVCPHILLASDYSQGFDRLLDKMGGLLSLLSSRMATPCLLERNTGREVLEPVSYWQLHLGCKAVLQLTESL